MRELTEAELRERLAMCGRLIYDDVEIPIPPDARPAWPHDHPQYTQDGDQNIWAPFDVAANVDEVEKLYRAWSLACGWRSAVDPLGEWATEQPAFALVKDWCECRIFIEPSGHHEVRVRICLHRSTKLPRSSPEVTAAVASYAGSGQPPPPAPKVAPPQPRIYDRPRPVRLPPRARVWPPCVPDEGGLLDPSAAVWERGLIFATDGDVVRVVDPTGGTVYRLAGGGSDPAVAEGPAKLACFRGVAGLAIDEAGLWFGDTGAGAVRRMDFASDSISTLADELPGPVALLREGTTLYVACRHGELFEIDTTTAERRPLEAVRDAVTGLAIVERTLYVATAAGLLLGVERTSGRVTQRLEVDGAPDSVARNPHAPWLYFGLPGRIAEVGVPDGSSKPLTGDGAVTHPRALAIVRTYSTSLSRFTVPGLYFFDAGNLCWLALSNNAVTTVLARGT